MSKSKITLINDSCANQTVDVVVNAANSGLWAGGGICGVIFKKAGMRELTDACNRHQMLWSSFFVTLLAKKISLFDYAATLASCGVA